MRRFSNQPPTSIVAGLKAVSVALKDIDGSIGKLEAREKRVQALLATLLRIGRKSGDSATMAKIQMAMQRENLVFTSVSDVLKSRHETAKNAIGNIR